MFGRKNYIIKRSFENKLLPWICINNTGALHIEIYASISSTQTKYTEKSIHQKSFGCVRIGFYALEYVSTWVMSYDVLFIAIFFFFHYSILNYKNEIFARLHEYDAFHFILGSSQFYQHVFLF